MGPMTGAACLCQSVSMNVNVNVNVSCECAWVDMCMKLRAVDIFMCCNRQRFHPCSRLLSKVCVCACVCVCVCDCVTVWQHDCVCDCV